MNLRTTEQKDMPLTPTKLTERIVVNWTRQAVTGLSHEILQYGNTSNYQIPGLEFELSGMPKGSTTGLSRGLTDKQETQMIDDTRRFFMAACYPSQNAQTVRDGGPPRLLFVWPTLISLTCVIGDVTIDHERFNSEGRTVLMRITLNLEEIRDVRLSSEQVRIHGSRRPSATAIPFARGSNGAS